jgi:hypothetical protein
MKKERKSKIGYKKKKKKKEFKSLMFLKEYPNHALTLVF